MIKACLQVNNFHLRNLGWHNPNPVALGIIIFTNRIHQESFAWIFFRHKNVDNICTRLYYLMHLPTYNQRNWFCGHFINKTWVHNYLWTILHTRKYIFILFNIVKDNGNMSHTMNYTITCSFYTEITAIFCNWDRRKQWRELVKKKPPKKRQKLSL